MQIDPDKARELAQRGASILLLDVPEGTRVGLDHQSFVAAGGFKGFKMVPPGPHFLSYNAASRSGDFAPTIAQLLHLAGRQVLVCRWSPQQEMLLPLSDEDEAERYTEGVQRFDFDGGLVPYQLNTYSVWQQLTSYVSAQTISRIAPAQGSTSIMAEADPAQLRQPTAAERRLDAQLEEQRSDGATSILPLFSAALGALGTAGTAQPKAGRDALVGRCHYAPVPRLQKGSGLTAAELTAQNLDKSVLLDDLLQHFGGDDHELLAEFQLAFVMFLYGQSLEGFAQWRTILQLALACERAALQTHTSFFESLLALLQMQLEYGISGKTPLSANGQPVGADTGMAELIDELLPDSFLQHCIGGFLEMLSDNAGAVPPQLLEEADKLKHTLQQRMGIQLDIAELGQHSSDEAAPVVVEL